MRLPVAVTVLLAGVAARADDAVNFPGSRGFSSPPSQRYSSGPVRPCEGDRDFCDFAPDYLNGVRPEPGVAASALVKKAIFSELASTRFRPPSGQEERACQVERSTTYPQKARNVKGSFLFIMNQPEFRQAVEVEVCRSEGQQCRTDSDAPSSGSTSCRQEYAVHRLYAFNSEGRQIYDSFSLPSACLCHHRSNNRRSSFNSAFGLRSNNPTPQLPFCKPGVNLQVPAGQIQSQNQFARGTEAPRPPSPPTTYFRNPVSISRQNAGNRGRFSRDQQQQLNGPQYQRPRRRYDRRGRRGRGRRNRREVSRGRRNKRDVPACSSSTSFCEDQGGYPVRNINRLVTNSEVSGSIFQQVFNGECTAAIGTRNFNINENQVCDGRKKVVRPKKAQNTKQEWMFIVNIGNYSQSVEVEECQGFFTEAGGEFGSCLYSGSQGNNPSGTQCRQLYRVHRLLALNSGGQLEVDTFRLPSACACFLTSGQSLEFLRK